MLFLPIAGFSLIGRDDALMKTMTRLS